LNPKAGIDVFLEPLINELKKLWSVIPTYDISRNQNFIMRAALIWTINDFCTVPYPGVDKVKVKVNVEVKVNVRRRLGGGDAKYRPRQEKVSPR